MRIEVLDDAKDDLVDGFHFYEEQSPGLGSYFLDSLFADIDSLLLYAGIHRIVYGSTDVSPAGFLSRSITASRQMSLVSAPSLTVAAIRHGFDGGYDAKAPPPE